jgi:hypothetical protein
MVLANISHGPFERDFLLKLGKRDPSKSQAEMHAQEADASTLIKVGKMLPTF